MKNGLGIDKFGTKYWYKNDLLHREDGPAIAYADGGKRWFFLMVNRLTVLIKKNLNN